jgi:uncharacterized membrane protein
MSGQGAYSDDSGGRFVLKVVGAVIAIAIGGLLVIAFFSKAIIAWGFFGAFAVVVIALLIFAWYYDRKNARAYTD